MVDSPCIGVCALNTALVCLGCGRHIDEIAAWSQLSDPMKQAIVERSKQRLGVLPHDTRIPEEAR
jgi:predicted Fe-S protein YdhL (DUF1289 family)